MKKITDTNAAPFSGIGLLMMQFNDGKWYSGSGCLFNDSKTVLTCGHNLAVKGKASQYAQVVFFYPAWSQGQWPNPVVNQGIPGVAWNVPTQYTASGGDASYDIGLIRLQTAVAGAIFTPQLVLEERNVPPELTVTGYPGDGGGWMYTDDGTLGGISIQNNAINYNMATSPGSSGSPIYTYKDTTQTATVYGVHVQNQNEHKVGIAITGVIAEWMQSALQSFPQQ